MGMLGAAFGVGFVLGPALGGALSPLGYGVPMLAAAGLAAANWVHALVSLREPARHERPADAETRSGALRHPLVRRLCAANFVFSVAVTQLETVFAFFMMDRFGYDAGHVAILLIAMALLMGGIQGGGMKALAARFSERSLVVAGSLLLALGFVGLSPAHSVAWLLPPLALCAVGRAILQPSLMSLASLASASARARGHDGRLPGERVPRARRRPPRRGLALRRVPGRALRARGRARADRGRPGARAARRRRRRVRGARSCPPGPRDVPWTSPSSPP